MKNREFGEGGSSDFLAGTSGIAKGKTRSEDEKCETKPAPAKADYSITSGIKEAQFGICFPSDVFCSGAILDRIDRYLAALKTPYRVVFESLLSEQWEGLDSLTVWPDGLSVQGKRKLMGFRAAGGTVLDEKNEEFL